MRNFILGIIAVLLPLGLGGLVFVAFGLMPTNADSTPPSVERWLASRAIDAALDRTPRLNNPIPSSAESLIGGMKVYTMNCSVCHGTLDNQPSPLENSFYPPVPQLVLHPVHHAEWRTYSVVRNGIRYTGMPSWRHTLSDQDMWKVTAFLSQVETLPPAVQDYWFETYGVHPPLPTQNQDQQH